MTHEETRHAPATDPSWFERNVRLIIRALVVCCVALLVAELAFSQIRPFHDEHHPAHFALENVFGYQAVLGFVAFMVAVYSGKFLRLIVRRKEDYYDA